MQDNADWWKDEEERFSDLTPPVGWVDAHKRIFKAICMECRQNEYVPARYLKFAQGPRRSILIALCLPFRAKSPAPPYRSFLAIEVSGPESLFVYDGGVIDIFMRKACKDKRFKAPKLNYQEIEELKERDPFAVAEAPLPLGTVIAVGSSPDEIGVTVRGMINIICRAGLACRSLRKLRRAKAKAAEEGKDQ